MEAELWKKPTAYEGTCDSYQEVADDSNSVPCTI